MSHNLVNLGILTVKPQTIRTGIVQKAMINGKWQITVGKMTITATSSLDLSIKQRVVIGQTSEGYVVLDARTYSSTNITEVKING